MNDERKTKAELIAEVAALRRRIAKSERELAVAGGRKETDPAQMYLDVARVMFVVINRNQRVTLINQRGCEILGYSREEIIGANWFDKFLPQDVRETVKGVFKELVAGEIQPVEYFENPILAKNGEKRVIAWHNTIIRNERGEVAGTLSSGEDITERRQAEEALRKSEAAASAVLEAAAEGIVMVKGDGRIVLANATLEEMFGYNRDELLGQTVEILLPERLRETHVGHRIGYFSESRTRPMGRGLDLVGRRKDHTEFPIEVSLSFVESEDGILAMGFVIDITERKQAEMRLHAEFAVTQLLAESSTLEEATPRLLQAICKGLGWQVGELWRVDPGSNVLRWEGSWYVPSVDGGKFESIRRGTMFSPGIGLPGRVWVSGQPAWMTDLASDTEFLPGSIAQEVGLNTAFAVPIPTGIEVVGVMTFFSHDRRPPDHDLLRVMVDIGRRIGNYVQRRRAEEQLRRQREALTQGEKLAAVGQLAAGVVHEMNNPLAIMLSRIEVVLMDAESQNLPAELVEDLRVLHRNTQRVARVAQGLLSFARKSPGEHRPVELNHVVEETLVLVEKPMTTDRIHITVELDRALPPLWGDSNALQQVLVNLLTNAREAMAGGGEIRIETGLAPGRPGWLRLVVTDMGPGIPPEQLPKIFDPFYTTKTDGTGLGLSVSYGIVRDHQGTVDVQSEPGKGTTFVLSFPMLPEEQRDA